MTASAAETERLVGLAREKGTFLMEAVWMRFNPLVQELARLVRDDELGEIRSLRASFGFAAAYDPASRLWDPALRVLLDLGTHLVDQATHLLGPVMSVRADVRALRSGAVVDDDAFLELRHDSRCSSLLWMSAAAPWPGPRLLVLQGGRAGWAKQDLDGQEAAHSAGTRYADEPDGVLWDVDGRQTLPSRPGDWGAYYRQFAAAVHGQGPVPLEPGDAVDVARVLEAAVESHRTGQVMHLRGAGCRG